MDWGWSDKLFSLVTATGLACGTALGEGDGALSEGNGCSWAQRSRVYRSEKTPQNPEKWAKVDSGARPRARGRISAKFLCLILSPGGLEQPAQPCSLHISPFFCQEVISWFSSRGGDRITCSTSQPLALSCITGINEKFQKMKYY